MSNFEFYFCYEELKQLWKARTPEEIKIAKELLNKRRMLFITL